MPCHAADMFELSTKIYIFTAKSNIICQTCKFKYKENQSNKYDIAFSDRFNAMGQILNSDSTVNGFRIYLGADSIPSNQAMMVVGTGSPDKTATIYKTSFSGSGPCPYFCDVSSPIMH
jgi:hypothetical protein